MTTRIPASLMALVVMIASGTSSALVPQSTTAFAFPTTTASFRTSRHCQLFMAPPSTPTLAEIEAESDQLRLEIKELRKEALRRLEALDEQLTTTTTTTSPSSSTESVSKPPTNEEEGLLPAPAPIVFTEPKDSVSLQPNESKKRSARKGINNLLDETRWKINLSVGREPGKLFVH